ncbi:hypothetical protein [Anaerobacillus alkalidiazotrophicus]|uniref:hypothetical protein n=1 Tax=Anaerobacillus alkalidiazotrophicus TaxID=472963 RepID=UPI0011139351|nr:hypothetical protein [Anaerobacillus alkalidiazotrophicus]
MKLLLELLRSGFAKSKRSGTRAAARDQGACAFLVQESGETYKINDTHNVKIKNNRFLEETWLLTL